MCTTWTTILHGHYYLTDLGSIFSPEQQTGQNTRLDKHSKLLLPLLSPTKYYLKGW